MKKNLELKTLINSGQPLLICTPFNLKKIIIKEYIEGIKEITFITLENLIKQLTFTFNEQCIYEVMKKFDIKYDVAMTYLNNLYMTTLITTPLKDYEKSKVNRIKEIYDFLDREGLLIYNSLYLNYVKKKKIVIYGYDLLKKEQLRPLDGLDYVIVYDEKVNPSKQLTVYKCFDFEQELHFMFDNIAFLLLNKKDINVNDIVITGIDGEHIALLKEMSMYYGIPINIPSNVSLYDYRYIKILLNEYFETGKINSDKVTNAALYNQLLDALNSININNSLSWKDKYCQEIIIRKLKQRKIEKAKYKSAINIVDINEIKYYDDKYVFVLGFNQDRIIHLSKDDDYYKDSLKQRFGLTTSSEENKQILSKTINDLLLLNNIVMSYSNYENGDELYPSSLIDDNDMKVIDISNKDKSEFSLYSNEYNKYLLVKGKDNYLKYRINNESLVKLLKTYQEPYLDYDNCFNGLDLEEYFKLIKRKVRLSYTSMEQYNECRFKYYCNYVLKLGDQEETFSLFIGNIFHYVLSWAFQEDFNFENCWNAYLIRHPYQFKDGEEYLLLKLKEQLVNIIEIINNQNNYINYKNSMFEKQVKIIRNDSDTEFLFDGKIDKLMYEKCQDSLGNVYYCLSVIDYKTGLLNIKLDLVKHGLSMQLPVYLFLSKNIEDLPKVVVKGFFLQNILHSEPKMDPGTGVDEYKAKKDEEMKLAGYIIDDDRKLLPFDNTESNSLLIRSLRRKKDGTFYNYSKVLSSNQADELIMQVKKTIDKTFTDVSHAEFTINPKIYKGANISCLYCKYSDICYRKPKDLQYLESEEDTDATVDD